ncbi:hypothetical protein B296_00013082 [Ensete ventricosum]|uniref:Uncharacterized protein n=1 Tax=Ensete ventricosum TaxID=4639 RepID=A0A427AKZ9_ENSVE|nr:hypothetical protein B296_00013082 [Ensete ventricosum]
MGHHKGKRIKDSSISVPPPHDLIHKKLMTSQYRKKAWGGNLHVKAASIRSLRRHQPLCSDGAVYNKHTDHRLPVRSISTEAGKKMVALTDSCTVGIILSRRESTRKSSLTDARRSCMSAGACSRTTMSTCVFSSKLLYSRPPQFDAAGVGARYRVSPDLTPLMSVIRALSPRRRSTSESPAGANTRVAFLMLQLRDRATP